ncbi:DUF1656 domain-containing protein [Xanthobacter sp. TB0136]|uniref:DUF1656 domain-containing protein n=1 Tax=Xanthobacter sp. TB0136 TaxID=3459177 RepID=UPI004039D450
MLREISIAGIYVPAIFFYFLASLVIYLILDAILVRMNIYQWFWHVQLVRLCLVGIIFSLTFIFIPLQ